MIVSFLLGIYNFVCFSVRLIDCTKLSKLFSWKNDIIYTDIKWVLLIYSIVVG